VLTAYENQKLLSPALLGTTSSCVGKHAPRAELVC